ncbi:MAG: flagellar filament capping protein FliD [Oryzihumus sp.]
MGTTIDGLISGMNTTQIIAQLMQLERLPEQAMTQRQTTAQNMVTGLQGLNTKVSSLGTLAKALVPDAVAKTNLWQTAKATTSDSTRVTATAGTGAVPGSIAFTVTSLATAGSAVSTGTVASISTQVSAGSILVAKGVTALGFSGVDANGAVTGTHKITVTQSSTGPSITSSAQASTIKVDGSNNVLSYKLDNGAVKTVTIGPNNYTPGQLAQAVQQATSGDLRVVVGANGAITLTSTHEGAAATLALDPGTTLAGFASGTSSTAGVDGKVRLDIVNPDGSSTPGVAVDVAPTAGLVKPVSDLNGQTVNLTVSGPIRAGSATATQVAVGGSQTLADVVSALNADPTLGVSAAAVSVGGAYRLQVSSTSTGAGSDMTFGSGAFQLNTLGTMQELTAASDTVLRVGTGSGAYDVRSSTATVTGILPGVDVTALKADPSTTVTLGVALDTQGMSDKVKAMVDQANAVLGYISSNSTWDATKKVGGPLMSSSLARTLTDQITTAVIGTSSASPAVAGVSVQKDGTLAFDAQAFANAWAKDPASVQTTMTALGQQISDLATQASDPIDGLITGQVQSQQQTITDIGKQIDDFEVRMTARQDSLTRQYAALETALGQLQSQSQWLSGQLAGLSANTASSK